MSFSRQEKGFIAFAMLSVMLISAEYASLRPTSNALFLTLFSIRAYPWVWLATVPLNFLAVYFYNRFLPKWGPLRMFCAFIFLTILVNGLAGILYEWAPQFIFFQFAWKDIYVLFMFKQLWSMIHSTIAASRTKYLYSCIYGMGMVGALLGGLIPSFLASLIGSEKILFLTLPLYSALLLTYTLAFRRSGVQQQNFEADLTQDSRPKEAFTLIRRSPALLVILALVLFMQGSAALMEYQFNAHLELNILEKDLRAAYYGKSMLLAHFLSLSIQFLGGMAAIRFLGLKGSHLLVPILLGSSALACIAFPAFEVISFAFIFLKGLEYSIFGVIREMLYVPLALDAKFRAKAIIDVFAYRTSKAAVSLSLLGMQVLMGSFLLLMASYLSMIVFIGWLAAVALFIKRKELSAI